MFIRRPLAITMHMSCKLIVYFFNVCGFLSVTIKEDRLTVSKLFILLNLVANPLALALKILTPPSVLADNFSEDMNNLEGASTLLIVTVNLMGLQILINSFFCSYVSVWRLKKAIRFIDACSRVFLTFETSESAKRFKRKCFKRFYISVVFVVGMKLMHFFFMYKHNWQAFLLFLVLHGEDNIAFFYMLFLSFFLFFFLFLLQALNSEIENTINFEITRNVDYDELISSFFNIYRLIIEFNKVFGFLLSLVTSSAMTLTTISVNIIIINLYFGKLNFSTSSYISLEFQCAVCQR